jgi:ribose transport system ATP-binding protein
MNADLQNLADPTLLECHHVTKSYSGVVVLRDVNFSVKRGEIHSLVGENGAGKSTLIKVVTGVTPRDSGTIAFDGHDLPIEHTKAAALRMGIGVIYQELSLIPGLTVAQNIYLTREPLRRGLGLVNYKKMNADAQALIDKYHFPLKATSPIETLSIAHRQLVEILKALSGDARLIIMDEPTSTLTSSETVQLFDIIRQLKAGGVSVIYISHRMEEVYALSDRVTVLRDGKLVTVLEKEQISPAEIIRLMIGRTLTADESQRVMSCKGGAPVLEVRNLTSEGCFYDISFSLGKGEILGLAGLVGAGRTEVMRAIFGIDRYDRGEVLLEGKPYKPSVGRSIASGFGFVPEDRRQQGILAMIPMTRNIGITNLDTISKASWVSDRKEMALCQLGIDLLKIRPKNPDINVGNLSGGNQQKVVVGKWLVRNLKVLIIDEPTAGIDIGAKDELYETIQRLAREGVSVICVSSDLPELTRLTDRIIVLREGRIVKEFAEGPVTEVDILKASSGILEGGNHDS